MGPGAGERVRPGRERVRRRGVARQRMGVDGDLVRAGPRIPPQRELPRILSPVLRCPALRSERRQRADRRLHAAPEFPQLVSAPLSVRLRGVPLRARLGLEERFQMAAPTTVISDPATQFASDVRAGLCREGQKELPSKYLYDPLGSTLFEAISLLPEYGLTRADERLLRRHAREIVRHVPRPALVSELGSDSGRKTRWILRSLCEHEPVSYYPIEISPAALASCESELGDIESVSIVGVEREYLDGLREVAALRADGVHLL